MDRVILFTGLLLFQSAAYAHGVEVLVTVFFSAIAYIGVFIHLFLSKSQTRRIVLFGVFIFLHLSAALVLGLGLSLVAPEPPPPDYSTWTNIQQYEYLNARLERGTSMRDEIREFATVWGFPLLILITWALTFFQLGPLWQRLTEGRTDRPKTTGDSPGP